MIEEIKRITQCESTTIMLDCVAQDITKRFDDRLQFGRTADENNYHFEDEQHLKYVMTAFSLNDNSTRYVLLCVNL